MILRPFFRYYGGKWRAVHAGRYPGPRYRSIVEPFAGAAGYALHYPHLEVHLIDRDPVIAGIWRWLVSTTPDEVRSIPLVDAVDDLPAWVPVGARDLIGFSMNAATSSPRKTLSAGGLRLREQGRKFYGWTHEYRERVATQVPYIKHWHVHQADFTVADCAPASFTGRPHTWFVDPPYEGAGKHYQYGPEYVNYGVLADWCKARLGEVIVCEQSGATWLPFRDIGALKAGPRSRTTREAVWP
jgi:hypothetical protein